MTKKSQKDQVVKILQLNGEVSRNVCIRELFITRLSAIIYSLEGEGYEFNPQIVKTEKGKDYVYFLKKSPLKRIEYFVPLLNKVIVKYQ